jgi:hypothetical protein
MVTEDAILLQRRVAQEMREALRTYGSPRRNHPPSRPGWVESVKAMPTPPWPEIQSDTNCAVAGVNDSRIGKP